MISTYFEDIFRSSKPDPTRIVEALAGLEERVTPEINRDLLRPFDEDEVKTALFSMDPIKAPGLEGFPALFYQKNWEVVGERVTAVCLGILNDGQPVTELNDTLITLIPKVDKPTMVNEFRPISLCNVAYKVISKCVVSRLKGHMEKVISENQRAFVGGRQIFDNVMVCFEGIHTMKRGRFGNGNYAALKIDMAKAYDRVEWDFLEAVMLNLGFDRVWVEKVMRCVTSVRFAVNINGAPRGLIKPERGLRQGDPLSHFLFLFCSEGLSWLLLDKERRGLISGVKFGRGELRVSHI